MNPQPRNAAYHPKKQGVVLLWCMSLKPQRHFKMTLVTMDHS
jgi:hypothetical protein